MANSYQEAMINNTTDQQVFAMEEDVDSHPHSLSRLSMCNTTAAAAIMPPHKLDIAPNHHQEDDDDDDDDVDDDDNYFRRGGVGVGGGDGGGGAMMMYLSRLSIESFDGDADEEFSDEKEGQHMLGGLSSDSDKDELQMADCYSLPGTPRQGQRKNQLMAAGIFKEYASENEVVQKGLLRKKMTRRSRFNRRRMATRERSWAERSTNFDNSANAMAMESSSASAISCHNCNMTIGTSNNINYSCSGESDQGAGLLVITRPKGGRRSLCMDMEEVKACNDLGFELEHERMLDMPSGISLTASTLETSSGGNSPIASWRISSPGQYYYLLSLPFSLCLTQKH